MRTKKHGVGSTWWGALFTACLLVSGPLSTGCGSKEETKTKSHHDDDDDTPSTRSSNSPSGYGTTMGTSARRPPRDLPRGRDRDRDLDDDPRPGRERPRKSLLGSITDLVGDLMPSNLLSSESEMDRAADEICACKDMECIQSVTKRYEKLDKGKKSMSELDENEKKAAEKMVGCVKKLMDDHPREVPVRPPDSDGGW